MFNKKSRKFIKENPEFSAGLLAGVVLGACFVYASMSKTLAQTEVTDASHLQYASGPDRLDIVQKNGVVTTLFGRGWSDAK